MRAKPRLTWTNGSGEDCLAGPVAVVRETLVGVNTHVAVLAQLITAWAGTQVGARPDIDIIISTKHPTLII